MRKTTIRNFIKLIEKNEEIQRIFKQRTTQNFNGLEEVRLKEEFTLFEIENNIFIFNENKKIKARKEDLENIEIKTYKKNGEDKILLKNCIITKDNYIKNKKTLNYDYLFDIIEILKEEAGITEEDLKNNSSYLIRLSVDSLNPWDFFKNSMIYLISKKIK